MRNALHLSRTIVLASLIGGCTFASQFTALREPPHPPVIRPPNQIELFASGPPTRPHVDVGLIYVRVLGSWDAQIEAIRQAASEHGCDAAVLNWGVWGAACVMYTDPAVVRPAIAAPANPPQGSAPQEPVAAPHA